MIIRIVPTKTGMYSPGARIITSKLSTIPKRQAPKKIPNTEPLPPKRYTPPITQAAIA